MKQWVFKLIAVVFSFVIGIGLILLLGEAYLRLRWDIDQYHRIPPWIEFHPERGWALTPGEYSNFDLNSFRKYEVSINSLGLRDREIPLAPGPGRRRITVLGDSFTFAQVLPLGLRFTEKLQESLGEPYEVVNVSAPGYGTGQEILLLEDLVEKGYVVGEKLLLVFFTNDILDNIGLTYGIARRDRKKPVFTLSEDGQLVQASPPKPPKTRKRKSPRGWIFYPFLRERAANFVAQRPWIIGIAGKLGINPDFHRVPGIITAWYSPGWQDRWSLTGDILSYFAGTETLEGTQLAVAFVPSPIQVEKVFQDLIGQLESHDPRYAELREDIDRPQRVLGEFCEEQGIPFIDATPVLRQASRKQLAYFPREGHLNEYGSEEVAEALAQFLR